MKDYVQQRLKDLAEVVKSAVDNESILAEGWEAKLAAQLRAEADQLDPVPDPEVK